MTVEDNIASEENLGRSILSSSQARPELRFNQYACRLDPVIVQEWRQLTANRASAANRHSATKFGAAASDNALADRVDAAEGGPPTDDAFEWAESRYDTRVALERANQLHDGGFALRCVWSASRIRSSPAHQPLFSTDAVAEQRYFHTAAGAAQHQFEQE